MGGLKDKHPVHLLVMVIGTLALTGFPLTAGYFSKDAIIEAAYRRPRIRWRSTPSSCTVVAALLTSFYSWRLIFKTFHGAPHDQQHYEAAHESPLVMLIPLGCPGDRLAPRRLAVQGALHRPRRRGILPRVAQVRAGQPRARGHAPRAACWIGMLPTVMMAIGFLDRLAVLHPPARTSRSSSRASTSALYRFLLNKWYFDELYDFLFVRPAHVARPLAVEGRRRLADRRLRPGRRLGARARRHPQRGAAADRLPLSLRLRHADRRRRRFITWFMFAARDRTDGELADPLRRHLPAAASARCSSCCCAATTRPASATRAGSRCGPRSSPSRSR